MTLLKSGLTVGYFQRWTLLQLVFLCVVERGYAQDEPAAALSIAPTAVKFGATRNFVTCEIERNGRKLYPLAQERSGVPARCKKDTIKIISFWDKPYPGTKLVNDFGTEVTLQESDFYTLYICYYKTNTILAQIRPKNCPRKMFRPGPRVYAMRRVKTKNYDLLDTFANVEPRVYNVSVFQRNVRPWDSRYIIGSNRIPESRTAFSRMTFNTLYVPYANSPHTEKLTEIIDQIQESLVDKYVDRDTDVYYAHSTWSTTIKGAGSITNTSMYMVTPNKHTSDINYQSMTPIFPGDVTAFRLVRDTLRGDNELLRMSICRAPLQFYNHKAGEPQPEDRYQVNTGSRGCRSGWERIHIGYGFIGNKETFPPGAFEVYIHERRGYPSDSKISLTKNPPAGWSLLSSLHVLPAVVKQSLSRFVTSSKIRSSSMDIFWNPVPGATGYDIDISPRPTSWLRKRVVSSPNFSFEDLNSSEHYQISVQPFDRLGNAMESRKFVIKQRTAPAAPKVNIVSITSSKVSVDWEPTDEISHYIVNIVEDTSMDRGIDDSEPREKHVLAAKPDTPYIVSVTGVIDEALNILTDTVDIAVRTSPEPPQLQFAALDSKKVLISWEDLDEYDEYVFDIFPPIQGIESGIYTSGQAFTVQPPRNTKYTLSLFARSTSNNRTTDIVSITRIYSLCQWTAKDLNKLNCKPKYEGFEHVDGFDWMFSPENGKLQTFEGEVEPRKVRILHLAKNGLSEGSMLKNILKKIPNIRLLNLENNNFISLPDKIFEATNHLEKVNLAENKIKTIGEYVFQKAPKSLFKIDLSKNPIETCGISKSTLEPVKAQLKSLDLHGTQVKPQVRGVLTAADLSDAPPGPGLRTTGPARYSFFCDNEY